MMWVVSLITEWIEKKKTGSLQINFFKGGITSVNRNDTMKPVDTVVAKKQ